MLRFELIVALVFKLIFLFLIWILFFSNKKDTNIKDKILSNRIINSNE